MAIRFRNETKNELKGYRRPRHAQSPKDVCFSTLCTANNVLGCLPKGWPPSSRSPTTMLSIWVGRDTTLCFPCISRAEPQSKAWVLNGLSALGMWSWGPRRKPPLVKAAVVLHSRCLYQRVVPSTERTWTLAESPRAWRWDRTWPFTKKSLVSWEDSAFTGGAEFDLTASENQRHVSSGTSPCPPGLARPLPVSCRPPHLWRGRVNMSHAWKTKWNISEPAKGFNSRNEQRFGKSLIFFSKVYSSSIDTKISLSKNMNIWGIWQRADSGNLSLFIPCNYTCLYVCVLSVIDLNAVFCGILVID